MRKQLSFLAFILLFLFSANNLFAVEKDKKAEPPAPAPAPAKKGPEKIMIFDGEQFKVQMYGFVKLDAVYNSTDVTHEAGPLKVENDRVMFTNSSIFSYNFKKVPAARDGSFTMDARTTRLGFKVDGPTALTGKTTAVIEFDFWGQTPVSTTAARQGMIRMRHAYGRIDWDFGTFVQIGQFWSVAIPTVNAMADTQTFIPFGANGLMFMREPFIGIGQKVGNKSFNVTAEYAAALVQGGNDSGAGLYPGMRDVQLSERGPGEASKLPGHRGRIIFNINPEPIKDMLNITLGFTGHYQKEKHPRTFANAVLWGWLTSTEALALQNTFGKMTNSYSIGAFTNISVSLVTFVGGYFMGKNMDTFLCGLGQGVVENASSMKLVGVSTTGGYGQLQIDFRKIAPIPIKIAGGYGAEVKKNGPLIGAGQQLWNKTIQGNISWYLNNYMSIGFEVAQHQTKYKRVLGVASDMRYHGGMKFVF